MNRTRRKQLTALADKVEELRQELESIADDECEARDNIPESMVESDKYRTADESCDNLENALDSLQDVLDCIEAAMA